MINKKIIVQVSEGLGNQLFMYAHGYSLSKKINFNMFIDNITGYKQKKNLLRNHQYYLLDHFEIGTPLIKNNFLVNSKYYNVLKKFFLFIDKFKNKKSFYTEAKSQDNKKKIEHSINLKTHTFADTVYVLGNFENPDYFSMYRKELIRKFQINRKYLNLNNPIINQLQNHNSISIHLRRDRFSDQSTISNSHLSKKSDDYLYESIEYINNAIKYFNSIIDNPKYFIWTNNHDKIEMFTTKLNISNYTLIKNSDVLNDFYLFNFSKHFIVSPSTFHWWGAWLNEYENKICVRPSNINPSNNSNFWPSEWISI